MSNGPNKRSFEYDIADAPMLLHALRIGASTAMLCGHKGAERRMRLYVQVLKDAQLPGMELFDEEVFAELGEALTLAVSYEVIVEKQGSVSSHWRAERSVAVKVTDRFGAVSTYFTDHRHQASGEKLEATLVAVRRLMAELAPVDVTEPEPAQ